MKLINVEPRNDYILRVFLDNQKVLDFDIKPELARIPCYKPLYDKTLFQAVKFKNQRVFWGEQYDFHLDQILEHGQLVN